MHIPEIHQKIWGSEEWICNEPGYCGKRMILHARASSSMHRHLVKDETFYVDHGTIRLETQEPEGGPVFVTDLISGGRVRIPPLTWHRFTGMTDAVFFEFSTHHDENDVERREPSRPAPPYASCL